MNELSEKPNPDATYPSGMCNEPKVCRSCPSHFLCTMKASAEQAIIKQRVFDR